MILYRTPGRSFTRPPRTSTIECSCRLWPIPGMYAVTSIPEVRRTRATLRSAEFGFLGVVVNTRVHTPRRCGLPFRAGVFVFSAFDSRPLRTSCAIVGTLFLYNSRDVSARSAAEQRVRLSGKEDARSGTYRATLEPGARDVTDLASTT